MTRILIYSGVIVLVIALGFLFDYLFMLAWNDTAYLFHLPNLTFWRAFDITFVVGLLLFPIRYQKS